MLQLATLVALEGARAHLLSWVDGHVGVEGRWLGSSGQDTGLSGSLGHAYVLVVDHLSFLFLG